MKVHGEVALVKKIRSQKSLKSVGTGCVSFDARGSIFGQMCMVPRVRLMKVHRLNHWAKTVPDDYEDDDADDDGLKVSCLKAKKKL